MHDIRLNTKLSLEDAKKIKALIWEGANQAAVAGHFSVSQTHVSRISRGVSWFNASWPNGDIGAIPTNQARELVFGSPIASRELRRDIEQAQKKLEANVVHNEIDLQPGQTKTRPTIEDAEKSAAVTEETHAARHKVIDEIGEAAEQGMNATLEQAAQAGEGSRAARADVEDETMSVLSWDHIAEAGVGLATIALGHARPELQPAICQALTALSRDDWATPRALLIIRAVAKIMNIEWEIKDEEEEYTTT